jgi:S1-C subfamily serine protease
MGGRWGLVMTAFSFAAVVVAPSAALSPAASAEGPRLPARAARPSVSSLDPATFAAISDGVGRVLASSCKGGGRRRGTGFLIGSQLMMTARHVVAGCSAVRVVLGGRSYAVSSIAYWHTAGARDEKVADVATLRLARRAPGFVFSFARRTPKLKTTIAVVGFPLGGPLSFNQGPLLATPRVQGVPLLAVRIATAKGTSGSAFLDPGGNVVGILQAGVVSGPGEKGLVSPSEGLVWGINLVRWWGPAIVEDLCRAYPRGGIPDCSTGVESPPTPSPAPPPSTPAPAPPPPPPSPAARPGHYLGITTQNERISFDITSDGRGLANLYINDINQNCTDGSTTYQNRIDWKGFAFPVGSDGRFSYSANWDTSYIDPDGKVYPAVNTFSITGAVSGSSAAGTFKLDTTGSLNCSSGTVNWNAGLSG